MTDEELIQKHASLFRAWESEAFPAEGKYNTETTRKYSASILRLEREAKRRGISKRRLMDPIDEEEQ
jgi:hypothetical protein